MTRELRSVHMVLGLNPFPRRTKHAFCQFGGTNKAKSFDHLEYHLMHDIQMFFAAMIETLNLVEPLFNHIRFLLLTNKIFPFYQS
jgi:hypothetical protein